MSTTDILQTSGPQSDFPPGTLISARGRDWVVLPESSGAMLMVRPLGGIDEEVTGICLDFEPVASSHFPPPLSERPGDNRSGALLRDAVRLGFRSGAGPFRSFGRLAFDPRPYQLVPLLLALRQPVVRLLIADDVGIGKTIEAGLIARELLDRDEIRSLSVLCLPHLVEQWQTELREKFHIDAVVVKPTTADRLERGCALGESLFQRHRFTVCSLDFVKSDRWRLKFLQAKPDFIIVDEAHVCAGTGTESRHQRHNLLDAIANDADTHLVMVTATPHSGSENAFRELLSWLNPEFLNLPDDLSGAENVERRRAVARHLVQRRRADIRNYLGETTFPTRMESETTYLLSKQGRALFDKLMKYSRELVKEPGLDKWRLRVRWWSALSLLRGLSSSPDAVAATLRKRAGVIDCETPEEVDRMGGHDLLDRDGDGDDSADMMPGADLSDSLADSPAARKRLLAFAKEAEALSGKNDPKLQSLITMVGTLLKDGFHPIVFCRFIPTAKYVSEHLGKTYRDVAIAAVTGESVPEERKIQVDALLGEKKRILVCTDCLSEGINLQEGFDAVVHYDLSWNPTRHEQREGRVDRYGQKSSEIRVATLYGSDNPIDGMVLEVLLRKHKTIRSSLGVSIPVPTNSEKVVEALFEALLLREERTRDKTGQRSLFDASELIPVAHQMATEWDNASAREKRSQTFYAQQTIKPEEVQVELERVRDAIGADVDVQEFVVTALRDHGCMVSEKSGVWDADLSRCPESLRDALSSEHLKFCFAGVPVVDASEKVEQYTRTHPQVERLAAWMLNAALDPHNTDCLVRRCGTIRTTEVSTRTTLLLLRLRFQLIHESKRLLSEECRLVAFTGASDSPLWLPPDEVQRLLTIKPTGNDPADVVKRNLDRALAGIPALRQELDKYAMAQGDALLEAHNRVRGAWSRDARRGPGLKKQSSVENVEPQLPPDVLGMYVYIPDPRQQMAPGILNAQSGGGY